jgi:uncharacterized protein YrrD
MDAKTLKGIAVVAIKDGEKIGSVDRVRFDLGARRVQAVTVGTGGLIGSHTYYLPAEGIQSIGTDAVMIPDRSVLLPDSAADRFQQYPTLEDLQSLRVVTEAGAVAGSVATVHLDAANGLLTEIEVAPPGITGVFRSHFLVPIEQVISIGRDVVVIPNRYGNGGEEPAVQVQPTTEGQPAR